MERVCMYLRKSRADLEAEARGEGETLAKHKKTLMRVAKQLNLNIIRIREEIVSGESLLHRPEMQELLKEVDRGEYDAVLVVDMDRLGRGNMQEQGLILETFRRTDTKIITPAKTYDLNNESDEFMSEVNALFARRELKLITGRMQRGRRLSAESGNYIATRPPYGYNIEKKENERFLVPHPEQAKVVQMIFEWYADGNMGANKIAMELNKLGYRSYTGKKWTSSSVLTIIKNEVYIGRIQWGKKEYVKSRTPGKRRDSKARPRDEWIDVKGKHEPLVDEKTFYKAQDVLKGKYHVPYQLERGITNPLAGLIRCDICGASMIYRPYTKQPGHLMCYNRFCTNKSSRFTYVEESLLKALEDLLSEFKAEFGTRRRKKSNNAVELKEQAVNNLERELEELNGQKEKLHDLLERGIYDEETYLNRSQNLAQRIEEKHKEILHAKNELQKEHNKDKAQKDIIPNVQNVIKLYWRTDDPQKKNNLLKSVIQYATYRKEKHQRNDQFTLNIYPRIPRN